MLSEKFHPGHAYVNVTNIWVLFANERGTPYSYTLKVQSNTEKNVENNINKSTETS